MLTQQQIDTFANEGVLVVENVLEDRVLESVKQEYSDLMNQLYSDWHDKGLVPKDSGLDFFQKLQVSYEAGCNWYEPLDISLPLEVVKSDSPFHIGPATFDMITSDRLLDLIEDLIGPEITSNPIQHVRLKPPTRNVHEGDMTHALLGNTDWHQDRAVALEESDNTKMITVWLAITDVTTDNGCLKVIPGKPKIYPHCPKKQVTIADGFLDESNARLLPVKAGGAILFHPLTPHCSVTNRSDKFRWSFDIRYNVTGQPSGRPHFPEFIARSESNPDRVLTDWKTWRDQWVDARSRLSKQDRFTVHRWSADSPVCA